MAGNTSGFDVSSSDDVFEVVTRDAAGAPTYVANWVAGTDPGAAFPGYDFGAMIGRPRSCCR